MARTRRGNGGATAQQRLRAPKPTMATACGKIGFCEGKRRLRLLDGVQGGLGALFIGGGARPLACGPRQPRRAWRGRTPGESGSFPSGKKTPTGRPHLSAGEDGRGEGERGLGWHTKRAGATWAERGKEEIKRKKEGEGSWAGLKNRVRKEKVLHFLKTTQTLQFKFEFKNSNSNRTTSNKTMQRWHECNKKEQPYLI